MKTNIKSLALVLTGSIYGVMLFVSSICSAASYPTSTATPLANDLSMNQYNLTDVGDIITKGPWVDVRAYASFSDAIDAIGVNEKTLLIPNQQIVSANKNVPYNITLKFLQGGSLSIDAGVIVGIYGPFEAGLYQVFTGNGVVSFPWRATTQILYPEWWGAKADNSTGSADAINKMIQASTNVNSFPVFVFQPGRYKITDGTADPRILFDRPCIIYWNHSQLDYGPGTGTAVAFRSPGSGSISPVFSYGGPRVWADYSFANMATFEGTGILLENVNDFKFYGLEAGGFEKGLYLFANGYGVSYGEFYSFLLQNNKIGYFGDVVGTTSAAYSNQISSFGGRFVNGPFSNYAGTRFVELQNHGTARTEAHKFYGTAIENTEIERKVKINADECVFQDVYWDQHTSHPDGIDIELVSGSTHNRIIGGSAIQYQRIADPTLGVVTPGTFNVSDDMTYGIQATKLLLTSGPNLTSSNFALSAGWGSIATVSNISGNDSHGTFTVTSSGSGRSANPSVTITFNIPWRQHLAAVTPFAIVTRNGGYGTVQPTWSTTYETLTITFPGTPTSGATYTFSFIIIG